MVKKTYSKKSHMENLGPLRNNESGGPDERGNGLPHEAVALLNTIAGPESGGDTNIIYRGDQFNNYDDHPRVWVKIPDGPKKGKFSSAAGKYQILAKTWDANAAELGITDFKPGDQDRVAWHIAQKEYMAATGRELLKDLQDGDPTVMAAIPRALHGQWDSLPGGGQPGTTSERFVRNYNAYLGDAAGHPVPPTGIPEAETALPPAKVPLTSITAPRPQPTPVDRRVLPPVSEVNPLPAPAPLVATAPVPQPRPASGLQPPPQSTVGMMVPDTAEKTRTEQLQLRQPDPDAPPGVWHWGMSDMIAKGNGYPNGYPAEPAVQPAVGARGLTPQQVGQEADNGRISGYRDIQEMGPSSQGAPMAPARPSGVTRTNTGMAGTEVLPVDRPASIATPTLDLNLIHPEPAAAGVPKYITETTRVPVSTSADPATKVMATPEAETRDEMAQMRARTTAPVAPTPMPEPIFRTVTRQVLNPAYIEQQKAQQPRAGGLAPAGNGNYVVRSGDTVGELARANGMSQQQFLQLNPSITDPNRILAGQRVVLRGTPRASGLAPSQSTAPPQQHVAVRAASPSPSRSSGSSTRAQQIEAFHARGLDDFGNIPGS